MHYLASSSLLFSASSSYANCVQRMGCDRARARRRRAAPDPPKGRDPRGRQALPVSTTASSSTRRSTISATISSANRTSRAAARARGGRLGRRRAAGRRPDARRRDPAARRVRIRAWAEVAGHFTSRTSAPSTRCRRSTCGRPTTPQKRLAWKRRHPLHVLLLRTYRIPRPVTVRVRDEYGGCRRGSICTATSRSRARPVLSDEEFERATEEIDLDRERRGPPGRGLVTPSGRIDACSTATRLAPSASAIGGGGDVVGALGVAERPAPGAGTVRARRHRPGSGGSDRPAPRAAPARRARRASSRPVRGGRARPRRHAGPGGVRFAEVADGRACSASPPSCSTRNPGPAAVGDGLAAAARRPAATSSCSSTSAATCSPTATSRGSRARCATRCCSPAAPLRRRRPCRRPARCSGRAATAS